MVQPTRLDKRPKPIYRYVPKVPASKSSNHPVITSFILSDKQDMVWDRVKQADRNGKPVSRKKHVYDLGINLIWIKVWNPMILL